MAKKKYEESNIQAIADAIREKTGTENTYYPEEMASGVNEVYAAGKTKEWSDFWDSAQSKGARVNYDRTFAGYAWTDATFKPKYDIKLTHATQCFFASLFTDMKAILQRCGVSLITGGTGNYGQMFQNSRVTHLPELDISNASSTANLANGATNLVSIDKLIVDENTAFENAFNSTSKLKDIYFEGVIGKNISFSSSPLSVESMKSIITHLKDYAGTANEFKYSLTLTSACKTALIAKGTTSPNGNLWTEYVDDLGWNLV